MPEDTSCCDVEIVNTGRDQIAVHARGDSSDKEPFIIEPGGTRKMEVRGNLLLEITAGRSPGLPDALVSSAVPVDD